jgi:hypothetical protein
VSADKTKADDAVHDIDKSGSGSKEKKSVTVSVSALVAANEGSWENAVKDYDGWLQGAFTTCKESGDFERSFNAFLASSVPVLRMPIMLRVRMVHLSDLDMCTGKSVRVREVCRDMLSACPDPSTLTTMAKKKERIEFFRSLLGVYAYDKPVKSAPRPETKQQGKGAKA